MRGTVDSIFILKMLIDKYVKSKSQGRGNLLFPSFVDFSKAFDCVPRNKLFDKLRTVGIKGHFLEVLMSMYSNDKSAVKIENKITQTFLCHNGVNHKNYNFLAYDWFKNVLFSTNSLAKLLSDSLLLDRLLDSLLLDSLLSDNSISQSHSKM